MVVEVGIPTATIDVQRLFLHRFLVSCVADLLEIEDLLGLERGSHIFNTCPICFAMSEYFPYRMSGYCRTLRHTKDALNSMNQIGNINVGKDCIGTYLCILFCLF